MKTFEEYLIKEINDYYDDFSERGFKVFNKFYNESIEQAKPRWIPVTERLPEFEINVLIKSPRGISVGSICDEGDGWLWGEANYIGGDLRSSECMQDDDYSDITHWMELPE
jgi:hypothetical protein